MWIGQDVSKRWRLWSGCRPAASHSVTRAETRSRGSRDGRLRTTAPPATSISYTSEIDKWHFVSAGTIRYDYWQIKVVTVMKILNCSRNKRLQGFLLNSIHLFKASTRIYFNFFDYMVMLSWSVLRLLPAIGYKYYILLIMALQLFMQSFGLLSQSLPSSSILDKDLPIWHFWLLYIFSNIILPGCVWSSCWPSWNGFPGVYCFYHSCFLHPFYVTKPSQSLCSNKVDYVLLFYYFIQFLVGLYSPNTVFIGWAKYIP